MASRYDVLLANGKNDTESFWIPLDEVNKENNLKLILGLTHKWQKLLRPTKWSNDQSWSKMIIHL